MKRRPNQVIAGCSVHGCQIFLGPSIPKWEKYTNGHKLYQTAIHYAKWPQNIPNDHKI
jgi:hypothetical protein